MRTCMNTHTYVNNAPRFFFFFFSCSFAHAVIDGMKRTTLSVEDMVGLEWEFKFHERPDW